jgi:hypothetical protein
MVMSIAKLGRKMHAPILGSPFGAPGGTAVAPPPGTGGGLAVWEGKGPSTTSGAVNTGFGGSAGGKAKGEISCMRPPGWAGLM